MKDEREVYLSFDAFGKSIVQGSKVLYSTGRVGGTVYHIGKVVRLIGETESTPEKVEIKINKSSRKNLKTKNPLVYASNVVRV